MSDQFLSSYSDEQTRNFSTIQGGVNIVGYFHYKIQLDADGKNKEDICKVAVKIN